MTAMIFYFSGTGNTKWAIETLQDILNKKGIKTTTYAIETLNDGDLKSLSDMICEADHIGFAFPLFGANIPRIMRMFIERFLAVTDGKPIKQTNIFMINTFGYVNGCGVFEAVKHFNPSPFRIAGYVNLRMPDYAPSHNSKKIKTYKPLDDHMKRNIIRRLERFSKARVNGKRYINGVGPHLLVGALIRRVLRNPLAGTYQRLSIDADLCTRCMRCLNDCPTHSISDKNGVLTFSPTCEACMRCFYFCPKGAISLKTR